MRCQYCNREIPDDSMFCPECGKEQNLSAPKTRTCPSCGAPLDEDALFCAECGSPCKPDSANGFQKKADPYTSPDAGYDNSNHTDSYFYNSNPGSADTGGSSVPPVSTQSNPVTGKNAAKIGLIAGGVVLVLALALCLSFVFEKDDSPSQPEEEILAEREDTPDEPSETETETDDIDLSDVDFNLLEDDELFLEGLIKKTQEGERVLRWDNALTFYGENFDGTKILLEDARNSYIDESSLPDGMLDSVKSNQVVSIEGQMYFDEERLYITPTKILDEKDADMVAAFEKSKEKDTTAKATTKATTNTAQSTVKEEKKDTGSNDYILPQSTSQLLGSSDISGLSLREINYAKNEIYARHGRLFNSPELQNYFNSKSWYHGTISPNSFSESLLSDIEKKNAEFLSTTEFGINPNGYQLDAN